MNKKDLIAKVSENTKNTKVLTKSIVDNMFDEMTSALGGGEFIQISGFGRFRVLDRAPRTGRNPGTGDPVEVPEKKIVKFKSSTHLKDQVNS